MSEAHQTELALLHPLDIFRHLAHVADLLEHPQHALVGATVKRAVERSAGGCHRHVGVGMRAPYRAHRARAAVLFVIGVQDEQHVQRPL